MLDVRLGPAPFLIAAFDARPDFPTELFGAVVSIVEPGMPREYLEHLGGLGRQGRADGLEDWEIEAKVLEGVIAAHDPADGEPLLETWLAMNARAVAAILDGPPRTDRSQTRN